MNFKKLNCNFDRIAKGKDYDNQNGKVRFIKIYGAKDELLDNISSSINNVLSQLKEKK